MKFVYFLINYGIPVVGACAACAIFDLALPGWLATFGIILFSFSCGTKVWNRRTREYDTIGSSTLDSIIGIGCIVAAIILVRVF